MDVTIFPLFVFFGFWWWLLVCLASVFIFWALEENTFGGATFAFLATLTLMTVFGGSEIVNFVLTGWNFLGVLLIYLALGVVWGFIKWYLFVTSQLDKYNEMKANWLETKGVEDTNVVPDDLKDQWKAYLYNYSDFVIRTKSGDKVVNVEPRASKHTGRITAWMMYWPWSLIWTFFADIVKRVFLRIQKWCSKLMDSVSRFVFKKVQDDF